MGAIPGRAGSVLVGRRTEIGVLAAVLEAAAAGEPGAVLVHGEAGVGKTRLVREVCERAVAAGRQVLWGTCVDFGASSLSYAPLVSALDRWASEADPGLAADVFSGADELAALLPSMRARTTDALPGTVLSWIDTVLVRLAERSPTVVVVDDLQWADIATLDALAYLVTGFASQRLTLVTTIRLEQRPEGAPLHTWLADVRRLPHVSELTLERLDARATEEQIANVVGSPVSEELAAAVHRRSRGNAYLTELLVKNASADLRQLPDADPDALREALTSRWHVLSRPAREVTRLVSVGGRPVTFELLDAVAKDALPSIRGLSALLGEAIDAGVLRLSDDRTYWFWHPLLAEVLLASVTPEQWPRMHAAYAAQLEKAPADRLPQLAADLAAHHQAAGDLGAAFRWSLVAADHAARLRATAEVSAHLTRACTLWEHAPADVHDRLADRLDLLSRAALAAESIGDFVTANDLLVGALALVDAEADPLTTSALLVEWTRVDWGRRPGQHWYRPETSAAVELTAGSPDSPERAIALARLAQARCWDCDPDPLDDAGASGTVVAGSAAAREALAAARRSGSVTALAKALTAHAMVTMRVSTSQALADLEQAYELVSSSGVERAAEGAAEAAIWWVNCLEREARFADAAAVAQRASRDALAAGSTHYGYFLAAQGASFLIDLGHWDEARELLRPALSAGGTGITGAFARCDAALLAVRSGRLSESRRHLQRISEIVDPSFTGVPITSVTVEVLLAEKEPGLALDYLRERWSLHADDPDIHDVDDLVTCWATAAADLAEQARDNGDASAAATAATALEWLVSHREATRASASAEAAGADLHTALTEAWLAAESRRCRGSDGQGAGWQHVRDVTSTAGLVWRETTAAWRLGRALLLEGAPRGDAAEALRAAHAVARRLGALPLLADVEAAARSAHIPLDPVEVVHVPGPTSSASGRPSVLTEREREVLGHVVAGRSNGDIARDLFISTKTVSVHVSNILRKTGTTSRVEAAAWARRTAIVRDP